MANINLLKPFILKWEGGYVNRKNDKGGPTNKGVTLKTFRTYFGSKATIDDLKKITDEQWLYILKKGYWYPFKGDYITNQSVANMCVDWAWNSGTVTAIKQVQRVLGVTADGIVGNITLGKINSMDAGILFSKLKTARLAFVADIVKKDPSQKENLGGWVNRINSITFTA
jgi:lysozyme family protein